MKIQSTEIEFIAFDTKDVIATSGEFDWTNLYMCASRDTISNYNSTLGVETGILLGNTTDPASNPSDIWKVFGYTKVSKKKNGAYNRATGKGQASDHSVPYYADPYSEITLTNVSGSGSKTYTYASTADDIYDWLIANGYYQ